MKAWIKVCSIAAIILGGTLQLFMLHPSAETSLDQSGKLQIKIERIGQDDAERVRSQDQQETELEKIAPDLFKEQTRAAVQTKQKQMEKQVKTLKGELFTGAVAAQDNSEIKNLKKALFAKKYPGQPSVITAQNNNEDKGEGLIGKKAVAFLFGFILLLCGGIYGMIQKTLE